MKSEAVQAFYMLFTGKKTRCGRAKLTRSQELQLVLRLQDLW